MISTQILMQLMAAGLWLAVMGQAASPPNDPLELATGPTHATDTREKRATALRSLNAARRQYALRSDSQGYDLKVSFTVNSGGQTSFDGDWQMEEMYDPRLGLRWTATGPDGYTITRINSHGAAYGAEPLTYIPLRLHEARAALFDPIAGAGNTARQTIRTSTAVYNGRELTCLLLSGAAKPPKVTPGRHWDETEECLDPQSGLLVVHSQVPGRYYAYDYTNAPSLGRHTLPRTVTITEAGKVVTRISVDSLTELPAADASLFVPSDEMKANNRVVGMAGAQKIWRTLPGATASAVCVFGVVTPDGQLAEAHSLQPSDPNSAAALASARQMDFSNPTTPGAPLVQHFVFVIEEFVPSR